MSIYAFYAMQPYLLELYGDPRAYGVAGLSAAIVGGAQIAGGLLVRALARAVRRRTSVLLGAVVASGVTLALIGVIPSFPAAVALLVVWGLLFAAVTPVRQAYLNELIPSEQRATGPVVRLADRIERRCRGATRARQGSRSLGLSGVVSRERRDSTACRAMHLDGPARATRSLTAGTATSMSNPRPGRPGVLP